MSVFQLALIVRLVRAELLEVLRADYIRFARARGLSRGTILLRHALRNALIPVVTVMGLQLGSLIAFSIITETVFQWRDGLLFIQAVQFADAGDGGVSVPDRVGLITINLVVDLSYFALDPRLRADRVKA